VTKAPAVSTATRARLAELASRELSLDDWRAQAAIPLSPDEIASTLALVHWFRTRYPTAAHRLAYIRRALVRWRRATAPR
jgi:hypothetical protein